MQDKMGQTLLDIRGMNKVLILTPQAGSSVHYYYYHYIEAVYIL